MSNQVKPFSVPICLGYLVWCQGGSTTDDYFREPEGTVFFDSPPKKGDTAVLCDGKIWTVVSEPNEQMEINMEQV